MVSKKGRSYLAVMQNVSARWGIPVGLIDLQVVRESGWRPTVMSSGRGLSPTGSVGLLQIHPDIAAAESSRYGIAAGPLEDPSVNLNLGIARMRRMFEYAWEFAPSKPRAFELALTGYHGGESRIREVAAGAQFTNLERSYIQDIVPVFKDWHLLPTPGEKRIAKPFPWGLLAIVGLGGILFLKRKK